MAALFLWTENASGKRGNGARYTGVGKKYNLAVAGSLVLFGSRGDTLAAKFFRVVFAKKDVPFLAAFQNFFFLGRDALADFDLDLFFFFEDVGHGLNHVLTDGVAIFDKFDFIALD